MQPKVNLRTGGNVNSYRWMGLKKINTQELEDSRTKYRANLFFAFEVF